MSRSERWSSARDHVSSQKVGPVYLSSVVLIMKASALDRTDGHVRKQDQRQSPCAESESWTSARNSGDQSGMSRYSGQKVGPALEAMCRVRKLDQCRCQAIAQ